MRDFQEKRGDQPEVGTLEEIQCLQIKELILLEVACSVQLHQCQLKILFTTMETLQTMRGRDVNAVITLAICAATNAFLAKEICIWTSSRASKIQLVVRLMLSKMISIGSMLSLTEITPSKLLILKSLKKILPLAEAQEIPTELTIKQNEKLYQVVKNLSSLTL